MTDIVSMAGVTIHERQVLRDTESQYHAFVRDIDETAVTVGFVSKSPDGRYLARMGTETVDWPDAGGRFIPTEDTYDPVDTSEWSDSEDMKRLDPMND